VKKRKRREEKKKEEGRLFSVKVVYAMEFENYIPTV